MKRPRSSAVPGFGLTFGAMTLYLSLVVLIPLAALLLRAARVGPRELLAAIGNERALAAFGLSFGGALVAAVIAAVGGSVAAWVLVRYRFPGRRLLDALVDLPFALPTAVSGIALATLLAPQGWVGKVLEPLGWKVAYTRGGVVVAMVLVSLPFIVRTLQPALADLPLDVEEAAATLGGGRLRTVFSIVAPQLLPALGSGFALAFARAVGEYGSVIFVAGNLPGKTEIVPLLIVVELEQYDYAAATALGAAMLAASFTVLLFIHLVPRWLARRRGPVEA
ncbi:MAG TPA: sulfate ABC transporter permease subunit CysT [Thermoanaerobaculia bacterium]|nr:sulfate ABC transporter permease subunit CysT [Thermoanaerobaculia bacterium]